MKSGHKEIALWQLDSFFLEPFGDNEQRKYLIDRLRAFIEEFQAIGIEAEIWMNGSFTTEHPEPADIDLVFLLDRNAVDSLTGSLADQFQKFLMDREIIKIRYSCDAFFIDKNDPEEIKKWQDVYGFDRRRMETKGIFTMKVKGHHV